MTDPYGLPPATPDTLVQLRDFGMIRRTGGLCGMMGMRSTTAVQAQMRTVPWRER